MPGCTGNAKENINNSIAADTPTAPMKSYMDEFDQGLVHHAVARDSFENATSLWNADDYANATARYQDAKSEYAAAAVHYDNMLRYAVNESDKTFAENMEATARDLNMASDSFINAINESRADNSTGALAYFYYGQALVNQSDIMMNRSMQNMPSWLS